MSTDDPHQETNEPEITITKPIKDWDTLRHDLAPTPEAADLLDTYGKPAWESLEHDLRRHPYLEQRDTFNQAYTYALWHRTLTAARDNNTLTDYTYKDLEDITDIPWGRIRDWELGEKTPHLERTLNIHEAARQQWEKELPHEAKDHLLDPSFVYNTLKSLLHHPNHQTPEHLAFAIETLYHYGATQRLTIAELKPYHKTGPQTLRTIAHAITTHHTEITNLLNEHLHSPETQEELRLAIDHDVLYIWRKTIHPDHWLNAYHHELLYLNPTIKAQLITTTHHHLNINNQQLGQLLDQLTNHPRERTYNPRAAPYELWPTKYSQYLYGDTLQLLLDTTNQSFDTFTSHITHIGRISNTEQGGGIQNPRFPKGYQLNELRARLIAIVLSDCHINKNTHVLTYHEKDAKRIEYVRNLFRKLGDTDYKTEELERKRKRLTITAVVGRLLEHWGVPKGDKHLHPNFGLPQIIRYGTAAVKCAYLQEVIPEEGYFAKRTHFQFGIKRAQVLASGDKEGTDAFVEKISTAEKAFIQKYGRERIYQIRDDRPRREFILVWGRLKKLAKDAKDNHVRQIAKHLVKTVQENKCTLLEDEIQLVASLGISMYKLIKQIHTQESGRVSAIWEAYTRRKIDTYKWSQLAMPSTGIKRKATKAWITHYQPCSSNHKRNNRYGLSRLL